MPDLTVTCAPILDLPRSAEIVIAGGVVAEDGSHDELLKKNGIYADLYRTQFVEDAVQPDPVV